MEPEYKEVKKLTLKGYEIHVDGMAKCYFKDGRLHRIDGPAIEYHNGDKSWCQYGKLHREDGPAMDWRTTTEWYLNDKYIPEKEYYEVWECPMDRLPLYINTIFAPIVARRCQNPSICGPKPPINLNLKGDPNK